MLGSFFIAYIYDKLGNKDNNNDNSTGYATDDANSENPKGEEKSSSSDSEVLPNIYISEDEEFPKEPEPIEENRETDSDERILKIEPLVYNKYNAVAIENLPFTIPPNEVIEFSGEVSIDGQCIDYEYTAHLSGTYRFEFSDVPNGTDLRLGIYNSGWEQIRGSYDLDNGDGITESLTAGELYHIRVEQYRAYGAYKLNVGQKKKLLILPIIQRFLIVYSIGIRKMIICM